MPAQWSRNTRSCAAFSCNACPRRVVNFLGSLMKDHRNPTTPLARRYSESSSLDTQRLAWNQHPGARIPWGCVVPLPLPLPHPGPKPVFEYSFDQIKGRHGFAVLIATCNSRTALGDRWVVAKFSNKELEVLAPPPGPREVMECGPSLVIYRHTFIGSGPFRGDEPNTAAQCTVSGETYSGMWTVLALSISNSTVGVRTCNLYLKGFSGGLIRLAAWKTCLQT